MLEESNDVFEILNFIEKRLNQQPPQNAEPALIDEEIEFLLQATQTLAIFSLSIHESKEDQLYGVSKEVAVILGSMIRIHKLFTGFCIHYAEQQRELAELFIRLIWESQIKMEYLATNPSKSVDLTQQFINCAYRSDIKQWKHLSEIQRQRPLIDIEIRMKNWIENNARRDNINLEELASQKSHTFKLDKQDLPNLAKALNRHEESYKFNYGSGNRSVHGDWLEFCCSHLDHCNGQFKPKIEFQTCDPRLAMPPIQHTLHSTWTYLQFRNFPITTNLCNTIKRVHQRMMKVNEWIENCIIQSRKTSK